MATVFNKQGNYTRTIHLKARPSQDRVVVSSWNIFIKLVSLVFVCHHWSSSHRCPSPLGVLSLQWLGFVTQLSTWGALLDLCKNGPNIDVESCRLDLHIQNNTITQNCNFKTFNLRWGNPNLTNRRTWTRVLNMYLYIPEMGFLFSSHHRISWSKTNAQCCETTVLF